MGAEDAYRRAARCSLASFASCFSGDELAEVLCFKGVKGPAERAGGAVASGADGQALSKAFTALGYDEGSLGFVDVSAMESQRLRELIEMVDPVMLVTLDDVARKTLCICLEIPQPDWGIRANSKGRGIVAVKAFEASLNSDEAKRIAWHQLKAAVRESSPM